MRYQRWLAAAFALACMAQPAQAQAPAQADARAATQRQTQQTDQANRDAAVPDEARSAATGAPPARAGADANTRASDNGARQGSEPPASYGPVLYVNGKPVADNGRRDPAEVHDEADTGANPATQAQTQPPGQQRQQRPPTHRRPAWQPANEAMAPRPLHGEQNAASPGVPIPPPVAAPQPVVPSSNVINGCQGSACMDSSGRTYNGVGTGNAGVNSNGRLCAKTGTTVQCF